MDQQKPSRPRKAKQAANKVQPPLSAEDKELFEEQPDNEMKMKYAPRMKVGSPTIKAPGSNQVTTVGLGNLEVVTINGNTNV